MESNAVLDTYRLEIPRSEHSLFMELVKKLGWRVKKETKSNYEQALDDLEHGRVNEYASKEDFYAKMGI